MTDPSWEYVALVLVNGCQVVLLAWIASRGARRRRSDSRTPATGPEEED